MITDNGPGRFSDIIGHPQWQPQPAPVPAARAVEPGATKAYEVEQVPLKSNDVAIQDLDLRDVAWPRTTASSGWWRKYAGLVAVLDSAAIIAASLAAEGLRFGTLGNSLSDRKGVSYLLLSLLMVPAWVAVMALGGTYEQRHLGGGSEEYRRVFSSGSRFLAVVAIFAFVAKYDLARGFVAVAIPLATALTLLQRFFVRRWLHRQRGEGRFLRSSLLVGSQQSCALLAQQVRALPYAGLSIVGTCLPVGAHCPACDGDVDVVLGNVDQILDVVLKQSIEAVLIADDSTIAHGTLRRLAWQLEGMGVALMVAPEVTDVAGPRVSVRPVSGLPLLHVEEPELTGFRRLVKEAFDRTLAVALLALLFPALTVIGIAVRLTSPGPALFKQVRVGLNGRQFTIWKLRTMAEGAEALRADLLHLNEASGVLFKIRNDPRLTRLGKWLRRWSIDELPQLWNVVRGDMSLVGPRPPLPSEVASYSDRTRRRLLVKPGLTGLWQVSGRSGLTWEEAVRLDLYYVENWSPSMDATILLRTVSAILRRQGAY